MKKIFHVFAFAIIFLSFANTTYAQKTTTKENTTATKEQQIKALEQLIISNQHNPNQEESNKAKAMLAQLKGETVPATNPKKTQQQLDAEEQKKMNETLSPADYDVWKRNKITTQQTTPNLKTK